MQKNNKRRANVPENDADLDEDKSIGTEEEMNVVGESLKSLSFWERLRGLSPHCCPLNNQMRDKSVSYVDLLRPGRPPSKNDDEMKSESSMMFAK